VIAIFLNNIFIKIRGFEIGGRILRIALMNFVRLLSLIGCHSSDNSRDFTHHTIFIDSEFFAITFVTE